MPRRVGLLLVLLAALVGCGGVPDASAPAPTPGAEAPAQVFTPPTGVSIPVLGVSSSLTEVDLLPDRTLDVPPVETPGQASWFRRSDQGGMPLVVVGHNSGLRDGAHVPGVFARLDELKPGDEVEIGRVDGSVDVYEVTEVSSFDKDAFPTGRVYGDVPGKEIRLITCGGGYEGPPYFFSDNVIAIGTLNETT